MQRVNSSLSYRTDLAVSDVVVFLSVVVRMVAAVNL
jgi:hypothetical protein